MVVDELLCAHELACAVRGDFEIGHPFALLEGPGADLVCPLLQLGGCYETVFCGREFEVTILVEEVELFLTEGRHFVVGGKVWCCGLGLVRAGVKNDNARRLHSTLVSM